MRALRTATQSYVASLIRLIYAYVVDNMFPLFALFAFGEIILFPFVFIYARYCSDRKSVATTIGAGLLPILLVSLYAILVAVDVIHQSRHSLGVVLGYLADATSFVLFIAPFEKLRLVIATKSSAAIPALLCAVIGINCLLWLINGIVNRDLFIIVPNIVGIALSVMQLVVYFMYRTDRLTPAASVDNKAVDVVIEVPGFDVAPLPCSPISPAYEPLRSPLTPLHSA